MTTPTDTSPTEHLSVPVGMEWQRDSLCGLSGDASAYAVENLPTNRREREQAAERLCRDCPVDTECILMALIDGATDMVVGSMPYTGHHTQRKRLAEKIGISLEDVDALKPKKPKRKSRG